MEEISIGLLTAQILNVLLLTIWIVIALWALSRLRREDMQDLAQVIWAAIILLVPIFGAVAFFIVRSRRWKLAERRPRG